MTCDSVMSFEIRIAHGPRLFLYTVRPTPTDRVETTKKLKIRGLWFPRDAIQHWSLVTLCGLWVVGKHTNIIISMLTLSRCVPIVRFGYVASSLAVALGISLLRCRCFIGQSKLDSTVLFTRAHHFFLFTDRVGAAGKICRSYVHKRASGSRCRAHGSSKVDHASHRQPSPHTTMSDADTFPLSSAKTHAILSSIGFLILLPVGVLVARYVRTFTPR